MVEELYTIQARKDRLRATEKILKTSLPISYIKAVSLISINIGIGDKTAREYIRTLVNFNGWIIEDGIIRVSKPEEKDKGITQVTKQTA